MPVHAATLESNYVGLSADDPFNWNIAENWSSGIPNNGGGDTFTAIISDWPSDPYDRDPYVEVLNGATNTISSLQLLSGMLEIDNGTTLNVNGDASLAGRTVVSGTFSIDGTLAQNSANQLTSGRISVDNRGILSWNGASIQQINTGAQVDIGSNGTIQNKNTGASALANLSTVAGKLSINQASLSVLGSLSNTGSIQLGSAQLTVPGTFTNEKSLDLSQSQVTGSVTNSASGTLSVGGSSGVLVSSMTTLDNQGDVYIYNAGELQITGSFAQQSGTTLTGGSYQISPAGQGGMAWAGANVQTIGANAVVTFLYGKPSGGYMRNLTTGDDALGGLQTIAGKLFLGTSASLDITSDLSITGTLTMGKLCALTSTKNISIVSGGTYEAYFEQGFSGAVGTGLLSANGNISLDGTLKITFEDTPDLNGSYQILSAARGITGMFSNALEDGARAAVYSPGGAQIGTFAVDYSANGVSLNNFAAVPEPGTLALMLVGTLAFWFVYRRRGVCNGGES